MKMGRIILIGLLAVIAAGCGPSKDVKRILDSPIAVETEIAEGADFSKYNTWTWIPLPADAAIDRRIDNPEFKGNVDNAVERELYTRGYRRNADAPDLLVNGHAVFETIDQAYIDEHYNGSYYPEYRTQMKDGGKKKSQWQEGTIILFIFDARTRELVYRAAAQAEITDPQFTTREQRKDRIDKAIGQMMTQFPKRSS